MNAAVNLRRRTPDADAAAVMSPKRGGDEAARAKGAGPAKVVPLIAAWIPARAVPAVVVPAIAAIDLSLLGGRKSSERGKPAAAAVADARLRTVREGRQSQHAIGENAPRPVRHNPVMHNSLSAAEEERPSANGDGKINEKRLRFPEGRRPIARVG